MRAITFDRVTTRFDNGQEALSEVSAEFDSGSMTFLTGHSGAGKSTFLRLLIGVDVATRGRIYVDGVDIGKLGTRRMPWYRREVGVVFQDHHLLGEHTVFDNVALPLRINHLSEREVTSIARAVVGKPKILLADEPTGNLDPQLARSIMKLFSQFNELGTTVIIASHDIGLIESMQMPTVNLLEGRITQVGETSDV